MKPDHAAAENPIVVVKIGGSLLGAARLDRIMEMLIGHPGRIVVVAGGGLFADAVRSAQARLGFGDTLAHRLAIDAMGHVGAILAERFPKLAVVPGVSEVGPAHWAGRIPVWTGADVRDGHHDIPESWSVTSDSLALWLARALGAARVVLVKSLDAPPAGGWVEWVQAGLVDKAFAQFAARCRGDIVIAGPSSDDHLPGLLVGVSVHGRDHVA